MLDGNSLCSGLKKPDLFAMFASKIVSEYRTKVLLRSDETFSDKNVIYLIDSIKRKSEASLLREIYGDSLYFVSITAPIEKRFLSLTKVKSMKEDEARSLISIDHDEKSFGSLPDEDEIGDEYKQDSGAVYQLADFFVQDYDNKDKIKRFVEAVFRNPHSFPSRDEYHMFSAFSASIQSRDLSRQVGAVIVSSDDEILGYGRNDAPAARFKGITAVQDNSDYAQGFDSNKKIIESIFEKIREGLNEGGSSITEQIADKIMKSIRSQSQIADLTEFGRAIHAEMDVILMCARKGIPLQDATLYTTTFPCHNCAKHIVGAGIKKVVYIEPYAKSSAILLHSDSILVDDHNASPANKVSFVPFLGISPRRFIDLFSMRPKLGYEVKRKMPDGLNISQWLMENRRPRFPLKLDSVEIAEGRIQEFFRSLSDPREESIDGTGTET